MSASNDPRTRGAPAPSLGHVAVVTGAARGIGRAVALALAEQGSDIVVNDIDAAGARATAETIHRMGQRAVASGDDITDADAVEALVARAEEDLGPIGVVVNNAGITRDALVHKMSDAQWDAVLATNLSGPFKVGRACARRMIPRQAGRIVNIASLAWLGNIGQSNYAAAKAGVIGMTRTWALELGRHGITVNAVAPGFIATPMTDAIPESVREKFVRKIPLRRVGRAEDVAAVVAFLSSEAAGYVSGQCIHVDGALGTGIAGLF
jgi:3-oxoacyl-(acyl-carrier-protein) reductase